MKLNIRSILVILAFVSSFAMFVTLGYAPASKTSKASQLILFRKSGVEIANVTKMSTVGDVQADVVNYNGTTLTTSLKLDSNSSSQAIYKIDVYNESSEDYKFLAIDYDMDHKFGLYSNTSIIPTVLTSNDYNMEDLISIGEIIPAGGRKSIYVSYHYAGESVDNQSLYGMIHCEFSPIYTIEYRDIYSEFPKTIIGGEDLTLSFSENIPTKIEAYDSFGKIINDASYIDGTFKIPSVSSSLVIKAYYD